MIKHTQTKAFKLHAARESHALQRVWLGPTAPAKVNFFRSVDKGNLVKAELRVVHSCHTTSDSLLACLAATNHGLQESTDFVNSQSARRTKDCHR